MSGVKLGPGFDDRNNLSYVKVCEGEVVRWRERDHIAFASDRFGAEKPAGQT